MKVEMFDDIFDGEITHENTKVVIDDHDVWSLDVTLAKIIAPALRRFKELKVGVPSEIRELSDDMEFDPSLHADEREGLLYERDEQVWNEMIDKMIWSFDEASSMYESARTALPDAQFGYRLRLQEGFSLFARYYSALWL